jgi:class 3 adenylate cyclase
LAEGLGPRTFAAEERIGTLMSSEDAVDEALGALKPGWAPWASAQRERRTFMFTDILGSTELAERLGDVAWSGFLHWHDETLRSLFATHAGEEIKHTGDGFFVAFEQPAHAVECAVAIQGQLASGPGDDRPDVLVRIGLHETEATRQGRDYHGRGVHEAARIATLAQGGQILASRGTLAGVQRAASDPRPVRLKGLSAPIEVVSVEWTSAVSETG